MTKFIVRRIGILIPLLFLVSVVTFLIIQLPPGNFVDTYIHNLELQGGSVNAAQREALLRQYGLDQPVLVQYFLWISKIVLHGDFGNSFRYQRPVADLLMERVPRTMAISIGSIILTWIIALPIGIYSALKKYSILDYLSQLPRAFDPVLPAGPGAPVYRFFPYWISCGRAVLTRISECLLVLRQVCGLVEKRLAAAGGFIGHRLGRNHPHPARVVAR